MATTTTTPVIHYDLVRVKIVEQDVRNLQHQAQDVVDEFNRLKLPFKIADVSDLLSLINGGANFIKERVMAGITPAEISGLPIKKETLYEGLQMPSFDRLLKRIADLNKGSVIYFDYLSFDGTTVSFPDNQVDRLKVRHTIYANTPEKVEVLEAVSELQAALRRYKGAILPFNKSLHIPYLDELFTKDLAINTFYIVSKIC